MTILVGPLRGHLARLARRRVEQTGFLLGRSEGGVVEAWAYVPVRNTAGSSVRFEGDPWDTIVAHKAAENMGAEVVAVFHTHPCGEARPSGLDLEGMRRWPLPWVIAGVDGLRGWILKGGMVHEVRVG